MVSLANHNGCLEFIVDLQSLNNVEPLDDATEDRVNALHLSGLWIQFIRRQVCQEELRSTRIFTRMSHAQ